jgi:hypothetical protein
VNHTRLAGDSEHRPGPIVQVDPESRKRDDVVWGYQARSIDPPSRAARCFSFSTPPAFLILRIDTATQMVSLLILYRRACATKTEEQGNADPETHILPISPLVFCHTFNLGSLAIAARSSPYLTTSWVSHSFSEVEVWRLTGVAVDERISRAIRGAIRGMNVRSK